MQEEIVDETDEYVDVHKRWYRKLYSCDVGLLQKHIMKLDAI